MNFAPPRFAATAPAAARKAASQVDPHEPALAPGDTMDQAVAAVARLADLLEAEFAALQVKDTEAIEQIQADKTARLQALAIWAADATPRTHADETRQSNPSRALPSGWSDFQVLIAQCHQAHWRNETLMSRQLEAIRETLNALYIHDARNGPVELYDRMGQLPKRQRAQRYSDA